MQNNHTFISSCVSDTEKFAKSISKNLKNGDILCLYGTLGMGKSLLSRTIIRNLCTDPNLEVPSPTFTLVQTYEMPDATEIWHFDLYRIEDPEEIYELGWEEALNHAILLIEWPERLGTLKPKKTIDIVIEPIENKPDSRHISIKRQTE